MDSLKVRVLSDDSGDIVRENNEFIFSYTTQNSNHFISLTMPVRRKDYIHNQLHPVFEMHLPEGFLLSIIKKHFSKILKTDDFGLLKVMSPAIKGRVTYKGINNTQNIIPDNNLTLDELLHPKSNQLFDELVTKFALNSVISGVQPKVLARVKNKATLKLEDYIVKSWGNEYPELALNEYYCMKVVQHAHIPVPEFFISDDEKLFIMKRFDINDNGHYLGFEDMCVLQAKQRDDKYDGTCEQIAKTIKTFVSVQNKKIALANFYKIVVINYLIKNGDAHLKNFGLLYHSFNDVKLAPAYDIVCTQIYIKNDIPALHLAGSKKWWTKKYLLKFGGQNCNLTKKEAENHYKECTNALSRIINEIKARQSREPNQAKQKLLTHLLKTWTHSLHP